MKDKIVGILKDSDKALTIYDLEDKLHLLDVDELQELQKMWYQQKEYQN